MGKAALTERLGSAPTKRTSDLVSSGSRVSPSWDAPHAHHPLLQVSSWGPPCLIGQARLLTTFGLFVDLLELLLSARRDALGVVPLASSFVRARS